MNYFRALFVILFHFIATGAVGQIVFERGYIIDNEGARIDGYIRNVDWRNTPSTFDFKLTPDVQATSKTMEDAAEFAINEASKFIRAVVKIDRSRNRIEEATTSRDPVWQEETLFLQVLIEGKANLFSYREGNLVRFFYSIAGGEIEQLVFKRFLVDRQRSTFSELRYAVAENNDFRIQLFRDVNCGANPMEELNRLEYKQSQLVRYFKKYHNCTGAGYTDYTRKRQTKTVNVMLKAGINNSSMSVKSGSRFRSVTFENHIGTVAGLELEFVLPFNKNKWVIVVAPTFQKFAGEQTVLSNDISINYSAIEFPVGVRHYFFINEHSNFFLNGLIVPSYTFDSEPTITYSNLSNLFIKSKNSFAIGAGFTYKRANIELRYYTRRDLLANQLSMSTNYQRVGLMLGYRIF
jgi:hypothetical protein